MLKRLASVLAIPALFAGAAASGPVRAQAPAAAKAPRTPDGKPNFNGVWAGPGFVHTVGPGDTDTPKVSAYEPKNFAPVKPGGESWLKRKLTGNTRVDDPTAFCLPNGLTRQILSPYAQQWIQSPEHMVILYEYALFRAIPIGAPNRPPANIEPTWMGDRSAGGRVACSSSYRRPQSGCLMRRSIGGGGITDALHVTRRLCRPMATVTMDDRRSSRRRDQNSA
jgi:hypothetical protein